MRLVVTTLLLGLLAARANAHELRPAYLELREGRAGEFDVLWKAPARGEMRLSLSPEFSGPTTSLAPPEMGWTNDAVVQRWRMRAVGSLRRQSVTIAGLEATLTDALVRIEFADGTTWVQRLTAREPGAIIPERQRGLSVAATYLRLGIEHILAGIDHLLFVLALLIITPGTRRLLKTVTAFTLAHSITLGLATVGLVHVASRPVEAVIALSIVFVAAEIVHHRRGRTGLTVRSPWVAAFTFGLLHGLGFAGSLSEVGLPAGHVPVALAFFNAGVEVGQLLFVAAVLLVLALLRRTTRSWPAWMEVAPAYAIGSIAMFWVIQRVLAF
jgi:hypothetical protein